MTKKPTKSQTQKNAWNVQNYPKQYKRVAIGLGLIVLVAASLAAMRYGNNQNKFSDKDYAALGSEVENIFRKIGGKDGAKQNACHYSTSGKYDFTEELYCTVEVAAYLPYVSDQHAVLTAKNLEREHAAWYSSI